MDDDGFFYDFGNRKKWWIVSFISSLFCWFFWRDIHGTPIATATVASLSSESIRRHMGVLKERSTSPMEGTKYMVYWCKTWVVYVCKMYIFSSFPDWWKMMKNVYLLGNTKTDGWCIHVRCFAHPLVFPKSWGNPKNGWFISWKTLWNNGRFAHVKNSVISSVFFNGDGMGYQHLIKIMAMENPFQTCWRLLHLLNWKIHITKSYASKKPGWFDSWTPGNMGCDPKFVTRCDHSGELRQVINWRMVWIVKIQDLNMMGGYVA